jgi:TolA-binding protein
MRLLNLLSPVPDQVVVARQTKIAAIFCIGVVATLVWQSSRQVVSVPQAAVALSPTLEQQLEAMSSALAAIRQSVDELATGLGQMKRDITNLHTTEQALSDKISEPPPRPAAAPSAGSAPRPSQTSAR